MAKASSESGTADQKPGVSKQQSAIERRKLKKIAVEKQRRARMNGSLAALRDLLQGEVGELEDADTAQVLDLAVSCLRRCRKSNPETLTRDAMRPHPCRDVTTPAAPLTAHAQHAHEPQNSYSRFSNTDLHKLLEYQNEVDRMQFRNQQQQHASAGACAGGAGFCYPFDDVIPGVVHPEGLVLRNLMMLGDQQRQPDTRTSSPWRPW